MLKRLIAACAATGLLALAGSQNLKADEPMMNPSWTSIAIGVADLDEALTLWTGAFGLVSLNRRDGADASLARLWDIQPDDIARQALVATPGEKTGMLHLVEFRNPGPPVRSGAEVFDLCPKNLDIYVRDMPRRHEELLAAGHHFRTDSFSDITAPNGIRFREIHMPSHDDINVVLLELVGAELPFSEKGYAGVGPLIQIVADAGLEKAFYRDVIGLEMLSDNVLDGPEIEKMIGLPPGAALDVSIWGRADAPLGQVEIIDYRGVEGADLYPRARPKSTGILHLSYAASDIDVLTVKLDRQGIEWTDHGQVDILPFSGRSIHFHTPAGMRIEVFSE